MILLLTFPRASFPPRLSLVGAAEGCPDVGSRFVPEGPGVGTGGLDVRGSSFPSVVGVYDGIGPLKESSGRHVRPGTQGRGPLRRLRRGRRGRRVSDGRRRARGRRRRGERGVSGRRTRRGEAELDGPGRVTGLGRGRRAVRRRPGATAARRHGRERGRRERGRRQASDIPLSPN